MEDTPMGYKKIESDNNGTIEVECSVEDELITSSNGDRHYYYVHFLSGVEGSAWVQSSKVLSEGQTYKGKLTLQNPSVGEFHLLEVQ